MIVIIERLLNNTIGILVDEIVLSSVIMVMNGMKLVMLVCMKDGIVVLNVLIT